MTEANSRRVAAYKTTLNLFRVTVCKQRLSLPRCNLCYLRSWLATGSLRRISSTTRTEGAGASFHVVALDLRSTSRERTRSGKATQ